MEYTVESLQQQLQKKVRQVYRIFCHQFGEDNVDLQDLVSDTRLRSYLEIGNRASFTLSDDVLSNVLLQFRDHAYTIMVYWPTVTVSNEADRSVVIEDLYCKVPVSGSGRFSSSERSFTLARAKYSMTQYQSDYCHSHVNGIPPRPSDFLVPCLGHGPIKDTIVTLKTRPFSAEMWMLFCQELSMYVTVESLAGVPYRRLSEIGKASTSCSTDFHRCGCLDLNAAVAGFQGNVVTLQEMRGFASWYATHNHLKFGYENGNYAIGLSYYEFMLDISNAFIEYFNSHKECFHSTADDLYLNNVLFKAVPRNGRLWNVSRSSYRVRNVSNFRGGYVCSFKGRPVLMQVYDDQEQEDPNITTVLNAELAEAILRGLLYTLNYHCSNDTIIHAAAERDVAAPRKTVVYI